MEIASGEFFNFDRVEEGEEECEVLVDVNEDLMMSRSRRFRRAWEISSKGSDDVEMVLASLGNLFRGYNR